MKHLALVLAALAGAVALAAAGCGGDDEDAGGTTDETTTVIETTQEAEALRGTVGPGFEISLETDRGEPVDRLAAGSYELEVDDRASIHNFHLTGPGVDVLTEVSAEGKETFTVELVEGTYEFVCDPHATSIRGSFEVAAP